jgi:hypothetical protein
MMDRPCLISGHGFARFLGCLFSVQPPFSALLARFFSPRSFAPVSYLLAAGGSRRGGGPLQKIFFYIYFFFHLIRWGVTTY